VVVERVGELLGLFRGLRPLGVVWGDGWCGRRFRGGWGRWYWLWLRGVRGGGGGMLVVVRGCADSIEQKLGACWCSALLGDWCLVVMIGFGAVEFRGSGICR